jgi:hypothetical protein
MHRLTWMAGICILAALSACGDSGNSTYAVEGPWSGSYTTHGSSVPAPLYGGIQLNGTAVFFDSFGSVFVFPKFNGSSTVNGTFSFYSAVGKFIAGVPGQALGNFTANNVTDTSISGSFTLNVDGNANVFNLNKLTLGGGLTPSILAGSWHGFYVDGLGSQSNIAVGWTMNPGGVFTGSDANGCTLVGTMVQIKNENLFIVDVNSTGGVGCPGNMTGLAFESDRDLVNTGLSGQAYYYVAAFNPNGASANGSFSAELAAP